MREAPEEMLRLEHWGCPWNREPDGHIAVRPFGGMKIERTWFAADKTGFHLLHTLFQTTLKYDAAERCADVVWGCLEEWGGETVRSWYWSVWNNPNSAWVSPGLTFEAYRRIYLEVAQAALRWLTPHLRGGKPRIGGPAVDTFQPFWFDWIWRFTHEIDNALIGFASWQQYGDWRAPGEWGAPGDDQIYRRLLRARIADYGDRAETIGRLLRDRDMLSVCSQVNVHAHHETSVSRRFNQTLFGAAYYASALLQLMRAGTDAEMFWMSTDAKGPYGLWDEDANPTPVFHAKRLCTQYLRYGDWLYFPPRRTGQGVNAVIARGAEGRSALIVHCREGAARYALADLIGDAKYNAVVKIDGTGRRVVRGLLDDHVTFDGYGVAVVTTHPREGS